MSEEIKLPTPEEIERGMLEKESNADPNILDNHAAFCSLYFPRMLNYMRVMNKKALMRVMELAIKYPIEESGKDFKSENERSLFNILNQLLTSKYIMIIHSAGEELKKQEESKLNDNQGEVNVGTEEKNS